MKENIMNMRNFASILLCLIYCFLNYSCAKAQQSHVKYYRQLDMVGIH
jgi:hypothetical protein